MSKISQKILLAVTLSVTLLVTLFVAFVEWSSYQNSMVDLKHRQQLITEAQAVTLSGFLHEKNQQNIYLTLSGIIANPTIVAVVVRDNEGSSISSLGTLDSSENTYSYKHPIIYFENDEILRNGSITTWVTDSHILEGVWNRVEALTWMVLLVIISIALSVGVTIRSVVLRPLDMLMKAITSQEDGAAITLNWHKNDEMGLLINRFNGLNANIHEIVDGLRCDIRDQAQVEADRFRSLADATFEAILIYQDGIILDVNKSASNLFDTPKSGLIGRRFVNFFQSKEDDALVQPGTSRQTVLSSLGNEKFTETTIKEITYDDQKALVAVIRDLTDQVKSQEKIEFLAHHDHLTGLKNRFKIHQELQDRIEAVQSKQHVSLAVLSLDLDGFKAVNDMHGHAAGDEVLVQVGKRIQNVIDDNDILGRLGGDEFVIGIVDCDNSSKLKELMNEIIFQISTPFQAQGVELNIGVSLGATLFSGGNEETTTLLRQSDLALYSAKAKGKGQYQFYHEDMEKSHKRQLVIENKLQEAMNNGIIDIHFQPQADLASQKILGFEALARWTDAELGTITPDEFIPIAERTGLIRELGKFVMLKACQAAALWPDHVRIAVNVSPTEFSDPDLVKSIQQVLSSTGLKPKRLEVEITENVLIQNEKQTRQAMTDLHELGIGIAIDDFGTGYASLSYLQRYPIDRVKIDKMFVQEMTRNPESVHIVRAITGLCNNLGIKVIAEGVETELEVQQLKMEQCAEIQGYYVGRPQSMSDVDQYFTDINNRIENFAS